MERIYFLNDKQVDKSTIMNAIKKRGAKLKKTCVIQHKFYDAPLTPEEKKIKKEKNISNSKFFENLREESYGDEGGWSGTDNHGWVTS
jgi:hypothetical protein